MSGEPSADMPPVEVADSLKGLPEGVWTYRRIYVFTLTLIALALVWRIIELARPEDLPSIAKFLVSLAMVLAVLYIAGPLAEHIVRLFSLAKVLIDSVAFWKRGKAS